MNELGCTTAALHDPQCNGTESEPNASRQHHRIDERVQGSLLHMFQHHGQFGFIALFGGCPVAGVDFQGISPMSNGCMEIPRSAAIPLPGEAEAGSAGKQRAKEYPGLRCANGVSAPG